MILNIGRFRMLFIGSWIQQRAESVFSSRFGGRFWTIVFCMFFTGKWIQERAKSVLSSCQTARNDSEGILISVSLVFELIGFHLVSARSLRKKFNRSLPFLADL